MMDKTVAVQPYLLDVDTHHPPGFAYEHRGTGEGILVMCFRTPARVSTARGMETAEPGSCLIHDQSLPHRHGSLPDAKEGFRNDWLMADPGVARPLIARYGLPMDRLLPTGRRDLLEGDIASIREELFRRDEFSGEAIQMLLARLLLGIRRAYRDERDSRDRMSAAERGRYGVFARLRTEIRREDGDGSVPAWAERLHLGPERFSALYRKFFGVSPYADRTDARLLLAQRLLATTAMSVKEIAGQCGWNDAYYFSRLFRKRFGQSPGQFRRGPKRLSKRSNPRTLSRG